MSIISTLLDFVTIHFKNYNSYLRFNNNEQFKHDRKIFKKTQKILNDDAIEKIISKTGSCYFPPNIFSNIEKLYFFARRPATQFILNEIQDKFLIFTNDLIELASPYSVGSYVGKVGNGDLNLLLHKDRYGYKDKSMKHINENKDYRDKLIASYNSFRKEVTKSLFL